MKPFLVGLLRLIECLGLALLISFFSFAIPGGIYELITGSPSDGFNFDLFLFGSPIFVIMLITLPVAIWQNPKVKSVCWKSLLLFATMMVVIRLLH